MKGPRWSTAVPREGRSSAIVVGSFALAGLAVVALLGVIAFAVFRQEGRRIALRAVPRDHVLSIVHVRDLVRALVLAAELPTAVGRTYFVADERPVSWGELYDAIDDVVGRNFAHGRIVAGDGDAVGPGTHDALSPDDLHLPRDALAVGAILEERTEHVRPDRGQDQGSDRRDGDRSAACSGRHLPSVAASQRSTT